MCRPVSNVRVSQEHCMDIHMLILEAILDLSLLVLGSFGASYSSPCSRLRLVPCSKSPQFFSLPFSCASDLRIEALADRKEIFLNSEPNLAGTQAIRKGLVICNLNRDEFQETRVEMKLRTRFRLLITDITTDYHLNYSAPCGDTVHFMSKHMHEQGRRLELRGGCNTQEVEEGALNFRSPPPPRSPYFQYPCPQLLQLQRGCGRPEMFQGQRQRPCIAQEK